jgi:hypothetical protein
MRASRTTNLASKKAERSLQLVIPTLLRRRGNIGEFGCQNEPATAGSQDVDMLMECRSVIVDLGNAAGRIVISVKISTSAS